MQSTLKENPSRKILGTLLNLKNCDCQAKKTASWISHQQRSHLDCQDYRKTKLII